jgi:hypothetical protein
MLLFQAERFGVHVPEPMAELRERPAVGAAMRAEGFA